MTTKKYLEQIGELDHLIINKLEEVQQWKTLATHITSENKEDKVQTSAPMDKMANAVVRIVDLENEIDMLVDNFIDRKRKIISQIESMGYDDYKWLFAKYVRSMTFDEIASQYDYTERHALRIVRRAEQRFEEKFGSEYLNI